MPYDTVVFADAAAAHTGIGGTSVLSLDGFAPWSRPSTSTFKAPNKTYCVGFGGTSLTKPNGCAISGDKSRGGQKFFGHAGLTVGYDEYLHDIAVEFMDQESISAYINTTNVTEECQVSAHFSENAHPWPQTVWEAARMAGAKFGKLHCPAVTVTCATTKTAFNGEVALATGITNGIAGQNAGWLDTTKNYAILGIMNMNATTGTLGTVQFRGLEGAWAGRMPGVPLYSLLLATFDAPSRADFLCYEPIPFRGLSPPTISITGLVAAAANFGVIIAETG